MNIADLDRLQFSFTIMFHYLFPIGTMGLVPFIAWYTYRAVTGKDSNAEKAAIFWTKIFAVNFAAGVVTGISMEFQFGTNWAAFSEKAGGVVGQPLAMEGIYAFMLEAVFLGFLLSGRAVGSSRQKHLSLPALSLRRWSSKPRLRCSPTSCRHSPGRTA